MTPKEVADLIPQLDMAQIAFPAGEGIDDIYRELTPVAWAWVKDNPNNWGTRFFSRIFFRGADLPNLKEIEGIPQEDRIRVARWVAAAMSSFFPKHEDKEAVCGMIFEMFFEEPESSKEG
jgi:hypothetical protein